MEKESYLVGKGGKGKLPSGVKGRDRAGYLVERGKESKLPGWERLSRQLPGGEVEKASYMAGLEEEVE